MIVFDVFLNGDKLCRAGVESGVTSTIITWVGGQPAETPGAQESDLFLSVGGLYHSSDPSTSHPRWVEHRELKPGDELVVQIAEASASDDPKTIRVTTLEEIERRERAYHEEVKSRLEQPPADEQPETDR
jgi:C-terminal processing protease CtpA/Prc